MKKKKTVKKIFLFLFIIVVLAVLVWGIAGRGKDAVTRVETIYLDTGSIEELLSVSGLVESKEKKTYFSPVSGKVMTVNIETGDVVAKGDILLTYDMEQLKENLEYARLQYELDNNSYESTLAQNTDAQKKLTEAKNNIAVLEQQIQDEKTYIKNMYNALELIETNKVNYNITRRMQLQNELAQLEADPVTNAERIKQIQMELQNLEFESQIIATTGDAVDLKNKIAQEEEKLAGYEKYLAEMEGQKQEALMDTLSEYQKDNLSVTQQLNLITYEKALKDYEAGSKGIVAEFNGVVTESAIVAGMPVMEDFQMLTLANVDAVKVTFTVSKYDLERIAEGQTADIEVGNYHYTGTVTKINKVAIQDMMSNSPQLKAEITIDNPDMNLCLGLDVKAKIHTAKAENVLLLPITALYADKMGDYVFVVEDGVAVRRNIVTGISSTEFIEVKEGITANDEVIVSVGSLEEGTPVVGQAN